MNWCTKTLQMLAAFSFEFFALSALVIGVTSINIKYSFIDFHWVFRLSFSSTGNNGSQIRCRGLSSFTCCHTSQEENTSVQYLSSSTLSSILLSTGWKEPELRASGHQVHSTYCSYVTYDGPRRQSADLLPLISDLGNLNKIHWVISILTGS